jgi:hypothetical protein
MCGSTTGKKTSTKNYYQKRIYGKSIKAKPSHKPLNNIWKMKESVKEFSGDVIYYSEMIYGEKNGTKLVLRAELAAFS